MDAENLRAAKIVSPGLFHRCERCANLAGWGAHGRWRHRRGAAGRMKPGNLGERLLCTLHHVAAGSAVHVDVHKPGRHIIAARVNDLRVFGPEHLRRRRYPCDLAVFDHHAVMFEHRTRANHPAINDYQHDAATIILSAWTNKSESNTRSNQVAA